MILFYFKDLILKSRIRENAGEQSISFAKSVEELKELLKDSKFTRFIADLSQGARLAAEIQPALRADLESIAVVSHVDIEAQKAATEAGFKIVMPRSRFVNELQSLLQQDYKVK